MLMLLSGWFHGKQKHSLGLKKSPFHTLLKAVAHLQPASLTTIKHIVMVTKTDPASSRFHTVKNDAKGAFTTWRLRVLTERLYVTTWEGERVGKEKPLWVWKN